MNRPKTTEGAGASALRITDIRCVPAGPREAKSGLLAWISFTIGGRLRIDGLMLRRTRDGRLVLTFPAKAGLTGKQFFYIRPLDSRRRKDLEQQVFQALGLAKGAPQ